MDMTYTKAVEIIKSGNQEDYNMAIDLYRSQSKNKQEDGKAQNETDDIYHKMLKNLPDEERICFAMFHLQGFSVKEIADSLDVSEEIVKYRLNNAKNNISEQLKHS